MLLQFLKVSQLERILERTARKQKLDARRQKASASLSRRVGQEKEREEWKDFQLNCRKNTINQKHAQLQSMSLSLPLPKLLVCRLQRQQNTCLSVSLRLPALPCCLSKLREQQRKRNQKNIGKEDRKCAQSKARELCFVWGRKSGLQQPGHTRTERKTHYRMLLRELPSADPLQCAFFGLFRWLLGCFLCPVAPRSERKVRTEKERQEQAPLPTAAYPHCYHWSSSSSPRCSSSLYRLQGTRTCTHTETLLRRMLTDGSCLIEF